MFQIWNVEMRMESVNYTINTIYDGIIDQMICVNRFLINSPGKLHCRIIKWF